jgi:hypothetical protein
LNVAWYSPKVYEFILMIHNKYKGCATKFPLPPLSPLQVQSIYDGQFHFRSPRTEYLPPMDAMPRREQTNQRKIIALDPTLARSPESEE